MKNGGGGQFWIAFQVQRVLLVADEIVTTICGQGGQFQNVLSPIPSTRRRLAVLIDEQRIGSGRKDFLLAQASSMLFLAVIVLQQ